MGMWYLCEFYVFYHVHADACGGLELELRVVVSCLMLVLGTKSRYSARATSTPNLQARSPAPRIEAFEIKKKKRLQCIAEKCYIYECCTS